MNILSINLSEEPIGLVILIGTISVLLGAFIVMNIPEKGQIKMETVKIKGKRKQREKKEAPTTPISRITISIIVINICLFIIAGVCSIYLKQDNEKLISFIGILAFLVMGIIMSDKVNVVVALFVGAITGVLINLAVTEEVLPFIAFTILLSIGMFAKYKYTNRDEED
ncbi:MAG: hypothetical protein NTY80_04445 [candidate division SR1 bacterium]|nr:hypothetical protein [candidate division SR1 bacterium]